MHYRQQDTALTVSQEITTGHTQNNGAVSIPFTVETAPFFCVCPVLLSTRVGIECLAYLWINKKFP
jgi:hypothetical protein